MQPWCLIDSGQCAADFNMAFDEAMLGAVSRLNMPALRFYGWKEKAASFGYFQKYSEVERQMLLRPLVRRPTAGGIVPHDADWTYSVAFPTNHEWYSFRAIQSYRRMHEWIQAALAALDVQTELAEFAHTPQVGQCFAGFELFDLLWQGRKIAGAAQRRTRQGLLIQGSVQPPLRSVTRHVWQTAMCDAARTSLGAEFAQNPAIEAELHQLASKLAAEKYGQPAYNRKR